MEFIASPNHGSRKGKKIEYVVIHWFGMGTIQNAIDRFLQPSAQASAHYLLAQDRQVQMVDESETAWHAGVLDVNERSIGIEHDANPDKLLSEEIYQMSGRLIREICDRYDIPLDRNHIRGHYEFKATQCPGTINLDKLIEIAKQGGEMGMTDYGMTNEKFHHMLRNVVYEFYKAYFNREPESDAVIEAHVGWIIADSGDSYNFKGLGRWINKVSEPEFQANWAKRSDYDVLNKLYEDSKIKLDEAIKASEGLIKPENCPVAEPTPEPEPEPQPQPTPTNEKWWQRILRWLITGS